VFSLRIFKVSYYLSKHQLAPFLDFFLWLLAMLFQQICRLSIDMCLTVCVRFLPHLEYHHPRRMYYFTSAHQTTLALQFSLVVWVQFWRHEPNALVPPLYIGFLSVFCLQFPKLACSKHQDLARRG
jgi:hypothetical protein